MKLWDLNNDGELDVAEEFFRDEMLCTSREEHIALFGDAGDWDEDEEEEDEYDEYDSDLDYDE